MSRASAGTWLLPCGLVTGSLGALLFSSMPPAWALWVLAGGGALLLLATPSRWLGAALLACCWTLWNVQLRLEDRLAPEFIGQVLPVRGVISSMPQVFDDYVSFRFKPLTTASQRQPAPRLPQTLLVRWYEQWPALSAGQQWRFDLLLKPPWGPVNFQGADREKWLFASRIGGVATVRDGHLEAEGGATGQRLVTLRQAVFNQIALRLGDSRTTGIVQALAVAERSGLAPEDQRLLARTGTSHLLAISGLHIGLAAGAGMLLVRGIGWILPLTAMGSGFHLLGILAGMLAAGSYAALAGFGVPTLRSLLMLLVAMTATSASRTIHPGRAWLLAVAAVLIIDPLAPLGAGFWFSFLAVAALLWLFVPRCGQRSWWQTLLMGQGGVMLILLPVSAFWFQGFSWVGFAANLVAIPMVSFGVVPFVLAGISALMFSDQAATGSWSIAGYVAALLLAFLEFLAAIQGELTPLHAPTLADSLAALLGAAVLLLPGGMPGRWLGLFLIAPLFLPSYQRQSDGQLELEVLDAGQGTAVLLRTGGHTLLYDSGPGDGHGRDMVHSVIAPALNQSGSRAPDRVVISHGDLDHAGGLGSVRDRYPEAPVQANLPRDEVGVDGCHIPTKWYWHGTRFEILHPSPALPYLGNDSSCVLAVEHGNGRILLAGDISASVEARLVYDGLQPNQVLLVPHHGSLTSSSPGFIEALTPPLAIATAGLGNRFGFPRSEIRRRYEKSGTPFWTTGECGALRIEMFRDGHLVITSARLQRPAIWRWPAAAGCPLAVELP